MASGFIQQLPPKAREALLSEGVRRRFAPGATLCVQGEAGTRVMVIHSGTVKITRTLPDGSAIVLGLCGAGDIVGEASAVAGEGAARLATVTAVDTVTCQVLAAGAFRQVLHRNPGIYRALVSLAHDRMRASADNGVRQAAHPVARRTARILSELAHRYGRPTARGLLIGLALSQHDLALLVGASRESVVRALTRLRSGGVIATGRQKIFVLDAVRLEQLGR
ncbi:Crp/Fnr family transcriptional regulator [Nonomuraea sp. RK-328]|nr:Crp/Fnr family transcriptional regulator [Nonomuraea sp. RK-328]